VNVDNTVLWEYVKFVLTVEYYYYWFKYLKVFYLSKQDCTISVYKVLERSKSPNFLTLFNNTASVALFNYIKLHTLFSMVTSPTAVTVLELSGITFHQYR
jgi:hypothetical protein